jgi:sensor histidine kinase YesM
MILQPFVENSIKHGVTQKEKNDGLINISISKNGKLICLVEDNGIGRKKAGEIKSTGEAAEYESQGMAITMKRIDTINKLYHTDILLQVDDVKDSEGKPAGTRVRLEFPPDME